MISLALSGFGFVRAGTIARDNCLKRACEEVYAGVATNRTLHLTIKGLLEARRFDEAKRLSQALSSLDNTEKLVYENYISLMRQTKSFITKSDESVTSLAEVIFKELIHSRRVAIVAPGKITSNSGVSIDSCDTVVRIKYYGKSSLHPAVFGGSRCDITSHNSDVLEAAVNNFSESEKIFGEATDLKLVVSKRRDTKNKLNFPVKEMSSWPPTFLTTGTSGTLMIWDVLIVRPQKIFLAGFDFYTDRGGYNPQLLNLYKSGSTLGFVPGELHFQNGKLSQTSLARNHISHNLRSDFLFLKNLYELSGLIDGTPEVLEILNLTADEYDMRLEEMLGDW